MAFMALVLGFVVPDKQMRVRGLPEACWKSAKDKQHVKKESIGKAKAKQGAKEQAGFTELEPYK